MLFEAYASANNGQLEFVQTIDCDSPDLLALAFVSAHLRDLTFELVAPDGSDVDLSKLASDGVWPLNDDGTSSIPARNFALSSPQVGIYKLLVSAPLRLAALLDSAPLPVQKNALGSHTLVVSRRRSSQSPCLLPGVLIVYNQSPVEIFSHLATYELEVGKPVGLVSRVSDKGSNVIDELPQPLLNVVDDAQMAIISPDGTEVRVFAVAPTTRSITPPSVRSDTSRCTTTVCTLTRCPTTASMARRLCPSTRASTFGARSSSATTPASRSSARRRTWCASRRSTPRSPAPRRCSTTPAASPSRSTSRCPPALSRRRRSRSTPTPSSGRPTAPPTAGRRRRRQSSTAASR
jgi:hypothetical protein